MPLAVSQEREAFDSFYLSYPEALKPFITTQAPEKEEEEEEDIPSPLSKQTTVQNNSYQMTVQGPVGSFFSRCGRDKKGEIKCGHNWTCPFGTSCYLINPKLRRAGGVRKMMDDREVRDILRNARTKPVSVSFVPREGDGTRFP